MHMAGNPIATRLIEVPLQNSANSLLVVLARQVPASPRFFSPSLPDFFLSAARFSEKKTSRCRIVSFLAVRLSLRCIAERRKGGNYGVRMPIERFKMPRKLCQTRYPTTERIEDKSSEVHNFFKTLQCRVRRHRHDSRMTADKRDRLRRLGMQTQPESRMQQSSRIMNKIPSVWLVVCQRVVTYETL